MNYRTATLLAEVNFTTAQTTTIPITVRDVISRIVIAWRVTRSGEGMQSYPHSDISKIELIDGSDKLHSLSGGENQAVCIYDRKGKTMNHGQHLASNSEYSTYGIDFGRYLYDPVFALDPTRFDNLQLQITHNHAVSSSAASSGNLEVWAHLFDEKVVSPGAFFMTKQIKDFTISAAGVFEPTKMPTDYPYRGLFIQGYRAGYEPWYQVLQARLNEDGEKRIPFDWDLEDYHRVRKGFSTTIMEQCIGQAKTSDLVWYVTPSDFWSIPLFTNVQQSTVTRPEGYLRGGKMTVQSGTDYSTFMALVYGWLPNHMFHFPFGDPQNMDDWYDVTRLGSLELRVKTGTGTSGNIRISVQQVRGY